MYRAPVDEIAFTLKHVTGFAADLDSGRFGDLSEDLVDAIVAEAGRFAAEEIAPLARVGDEQGASRLEQVPSSGETIGDLGAQLREPRGGQQLFGQL